MEKFNHLALAIVLGASITAHAVQPALKLDTYNAGDKAIFPISSTLVEGKHDAVLIDAQFSRSDAQKVVDQVRASGKKLTTIYISQGDPDFYFGLQFVHAAFPDAKIVTTAPTLARINETRQAKLAYWGPILKNDAPTEVLLPTALSQPSIDLEGNKLEIVGLDGPTPDRTFVWIPAIKAVVGGVLVFNDEHVFMADTQTPESHKNWLDALDHIDKLHPDIVVPGHYAANSTHTIAAVKFTRDYIHAYDAEAAKAKNSAELIAAMKQRYPKAGSVGSLELSAKVSKGEMKWP